MYENVKNGYREFDHSGTLKVLVRHCLLSGHFDYLIDEEHHVER